MSLTIADNSEKCCPKTPEEAGMPERFTEWRKDQPEFIEMGLRPSKRITTICAPTGFGKQVTCATIALASKEPTCIVVPNRGLQDQYESMGIPGLVLLKGRKNYICTLKDDPDYTCEDGYAGRCPYKGSAMCPSSQADMRASQSSLVVTNYDKWTTSKKFGLGMDHFTQVIFDEGHEAPDAMARAMRVTLHSHEIEKTLEVPFLGGSFADEMFEWKQWAIGVRAVAEAKMIEARSRLAHSHDPKPSWIKHYLHMKNLWRRLGTLSMAAVRDWVVEQVEDGFRFDPIRPGRYAESTLLFHVPHVMFVSATIQPKTMYMCGIGREHFTFKEFSSSFDPNRCPVYWIPTMKVRYGQDNSPLWVRLDQILAARAGSRLHRNGIIHTVSFQRQQEIVNSSRFSEQFIINDKGEAPTSKVEEFKAYPNTGSVLVSPSVGAGYDFPDDTCRFQFVCKVPFEPPSKIQKARQEDDKEYVYYRAMQILVQNFGRDMRSETDWSERFIADDQFDWFYRRYKHLAPKSFHAVVKQADILPRPIQF